MTGSVPLRVLLADDHAVVRKGIREFLEEDGEVTVVAEASGGAEAVRLAGEHRPAVAVLDVQMPGVNGIEATRQIKAAYPEIRVLIPYRVRRGSVRFRPAARRRRWLRAEEQRP